MPSHKAETIGSRVREARKKAGLSQAELAKLCNVTQATIQKIETSRSANSRFLSIVWARLGLPLVELDPGYSADIASLRDRGLTIIEAKDPRPASQPRPLSAAAGEFEIRWQDEPPTWHAYDIVDLHYGRAIDKQTGREGVAIMWRLRDGSYLIGVIDAETARRSLKLGHFQTIVEQAAAASPKR
jgi:transcriptional regulator with XRE-family HTH domain